MLEKTFQSSLIKELRTILPGSIILKNDANYIQGFPDILILYEDRWAVLECKRSLKSYVGPNQQYYINQLGNMSFASFISPENKEEVLHDLQKSFGIIRSTRISISK